jgi:predicted outer membrane protein
MTVRRFLGTLLALQLVFAVAATGSASAQDEPGQQTPLGPISAADKDLLIKVKQSSLWEGPVGEEAQTRSQNQRVREVGLQLAADHRKLDERLAALAGKMRVALPAAVSSDHQSWIDELRGLNGKAFDTAFANRLRSAHGQGFNQIAKVRLGTRNQAIREFAQVTNDVIAKHMTMLESTGLVTQAGMSDPVHAGATPGGPALAGALGGSSSPLMIGLIVLVGAIVTITLLRLTKTRHPVD